MKEVAEFVSYYEKLLCIAILLLLDNLEIGVGCKGWVNAQCSAAISLEVRKALFDIRNNKTPRSDGYGIKFEKAAWNTIGADLQQAIMEFFSLGRLLKQWNHTLIVLVPKTTHGLCATD